jgi:hypothetical protein
VRSRPPSKTGIPVFPAASKEIPATASRAANLQKGAQLTFGTPNRLLCTFPEKRWRKTCPQHLVLSLPFSRAA